MARRNREALITGASSGLGREFAHQIADSGINVVLVARREDQLKEVGEEIFRQFRVEYRVVATDLATENFMKVISEATDDLGIGLVISNAGSANPGRFTNKEPKELAATLRLSALGMPN